MQSLIEKFSSVCEIYSDRIAVEYEAHQVSYGQLDLKITKIASWLIHQGVKKGDRVAIHQVNSINYITNYYACWRAGLIPVPLNTLSKARELEIWIENCGCKLVFSDQLSSIESKIPVFSTSHDCEINVDENNRSAAADSMTFEFPDLNDVATIIYTSGTTGNPKGIALSHRNLAANMDAIIQSLLIVNTDVFLCVLPFFYSFGNSILHTHLMVGAKLVLLNKVMYPMEILKTIETLQCNGLAGVPSLYISLLKKTNFAQYNLNSLRYMTQAGGPLARDYISQINQLLPRVDFVVMYGQTEASARIAYLPAELLLQKIGAVGVGISGVKITLLNDKGEECKPQQKGEICVSGDNVMLGYWNNPIATAKVLKDGLLRTGDIGYKDSDSFLYIVGRQTEMLKISEHRVSPYEIEEVVLQMSSIDECAVVGCSHELKGQYAKAFVVTNDPSVSENQIKKFCQQELASYKVPKIIEFVESIPKTSSGKINRSMLQR